MSEHALTVGVDIGGTKIAAGVVDASGQILVRAFRSTDPRDPEQIEAAVADAVAELRAQYPQVDAVGAAAAGFVGPDRTTMLFAPNIAWRHHPLGTRLADRIGLPVVIENDANAAAWAEYRFGNGRGTRDMVMLTLGTGLGGAVVADGRLLRGAFGAAAELGHVTVVPDGHFCGCGQEGCWEAYASGTALARLARNVATSDPEGARAMLAVADGEPLSGAHVTAAARQGDPVATGLMHRFGRYLGLGIATLTAVVDPEVVVVGGGIAGAAGDLILPAAREGFLAKLSGRGFRGEPRIVTAALANDAGIIGAADSARTPSSAPAAAAVPA
ncbi:glucokinase [Cellulomonas hominis]|uniref:Glucokinase n=1 Tax=Cellulomonas hominis TaxID=156981 RepID=A0A511F862_9CELL|nr:ROK family glucokinase [Cellulomonas hominis]MBB5473130.1 glucokinase [Cellulomonas hominis]NKY05821.1 ROK family glucokinase [Cellulomonas hominis]GEL45442.1 glucokinase [Cellulomonas hominis]